MLDSVGPRRSAAVEILAVAGLLALSTLVRIPLPFSPVPVTMQTFAVLVAAFAVRRTSAAAGIGLYVALGMVGAPFFATVTGATVGYLAAFLLTPFLVARIERPAVAIAAAMTLIYAMGAGWLMLWGGLNPAQAIMVGVAPFVIGDAMKAAAAYGVARWLRK